ncbi:hypothetical protein E2C01_093834 [Portunus trituberculatus]|uniref:Uncharacterized protein n=1 Tax=Portunus trituberculatus TaxID=210409 RepID=A0A5B7JVJ4_PORTR|nr:hypothetical protein [Portunus trituberculatus]
MPPPLNTTTCANGNLPYVLVGLAQLGRQVHRDICVRSSAMSTSDISCKGCEFAYWEIIAPAMQVSVQSRRGPARTFILLLSPSKLGGLWGIGDFRGGDIFE